MKFRRSEVRGAQRRVYIRIYGSIVNEYSFPDLKYT